ncbi:MAG: hypothetical protein R3B48_25410 [Kofleriaceae bacterium]
MRMGLFTLFARLAEPPRPGTGGWKIRTGDGHQGVVLMEGGRICWANHDQGGRLSDEIERRFGVDRSTIEQVIRLCKERNKPFGASLVEEGCITQAELASALREHTCRSILSLVKAGVYQCEWVHHQGGGYAAETTITLAQTVSSCVALLKGLNPEGLEASLETIVAGEAAGLLVHAAARLPISASVNPVAWSELRSWFTWALHVDGACHLASQAFLAGRGPKGGWVLWRVGSIIGLAVSRSEEVQRRVLLRVSSALPDWAVEQPRP